MHRTCWTGLIGLAIVGWSANAVAHPGHDHGRPTTIRVWTKKDSGQEVRGAFVAARDGSIQIRKLDDSLLSMKVEDLSIADRQFVDERTNQVRELNLKRLNAIFAAEAAATQRPHVTAPLIELAQRAIPRNRNMEPTLARDPKRPAIADAFEPFAQLKSILYRWDDKYFYVESNGIPDHPLMIGIKAWQQQVPLPQKYFGDNAWMIPLHPVPAKEPASTNGRFLRGAIALAVNGIPIFNPLNNRGDDAYLFGELDNYGGHCGRGDDYHYHLAPMHLQKQVGKGKPIAYALDGYPIYGYEEPDGGKAAQLDELGGHQDKAGNYHYHAQKTYPYLNGGFYGEVTEIEGQVDPQPHAEPVREALPPLRGAKIVGFEYTPPNKFLLTYDVNGGKGTVAWSVKGDGAATFRFTDVDGQVRDEVYQPRGRRPGEAGQGAGQRGSASASGAQRAAPTRSRGPVQQLVVSSSAFTAGGNLPVTFTCDGEGVSPPVSWTAGPAGTKSYALNLWHIPQPGEIKSYWVVYDIPANTTKLPKNATAIGRLGRNDHDRTAYDPMCSKGPGVKQYAVTVYALSKELNLKPDSVNREVLLEAIEDCTLAEGTLTYNYARGGQK